MPLSQLPHVTPLLQTQVPAVTTLAKANIAKMQKTAEFLLIVDGENIWFEWFGNVKKLCTFKGMANTSL
jgi:hypothetical protein